MNNIFKFIVPIFIIISIFCYVGNSTAQLQNQGIIFIVNSDNPLMEINKETVALYYLKKVKFWPNNQTIRFFDRSDESDLRKYFLDNFLGMTHREVDSFWIGQKLNSGDSAPVQVNDDLAMARLVSKFPESIGYVSSGFVMVKGIKIINITGK